MNAKKELRGGIILDIEDGKDLLQVPRPCSWGVPLMVKVREASFNDFKEVEALEARYGLPSKTPEVRCHIWRDNPTILETKKPWPIGWVLENDDKKVVGYYGSIPLTYEMGGRKIFAAAGSSFVVDLPYRGYSVFLVKRFFGQKYADMLLMTTPSYEANRIYEAFKAKKIPINDYDVVRFWVVDYEKFVRSLLIKKKFPMHKIVSYPIAMIMQGLDLIIRKKRFIEEEGHIVDFYSDFTDEFDLFWERLKKRFPNRVLYVRNKEHLCWHFKYPLINKSAWLSVVKNNDESIKAYAIFLRQDNKSIGLKRLRLIDFQSLDDDQAILTSLISSGIKKCREQGMHLLEVVGFDGLKKKIIERCSPHRRRLPNWPFYYKTKERLLAQELSNSAIWDPSLLDGDSSM